MGAEPAEVSPHNRERSAGKKRADGKPVGKPFQLGNRANPGGRPKGLARRVRETVGNDGEGLAEFWDAVLAGEVRTRKTTVGKDGKESVRFVYESVSMGDRVAVSKLIAERGWGKPPEFVPIESEDPLGLAEADAAEIASSLDARWDELAAKREERAAAVGE